MANVNDVRRADEQVQRELTKLDDAEAAGLVAPEDADAIRAAWRHHKRGRWSKPLSQRDRLGQLRRAAAVAVADGRRHGPPGPLVDLDAVDDANCLLDDLAAGVDGLYGLDDDGEPSGRLLVPGYSSPSTGSTYVGALRALFEYLDANGDGDYPWHDDIPYPEREDRRKDPEEMLDPEDVAAISEHTVDYREAAFAEFLADTGLRASAACQLRVGDVDIDGQPPTWRFNPDGAAQKGADEHDFSRWDLYYSTVHMREWLNERHPDPHPDAPLWPKRHGYNRTDRENGAASPRTLMNLVREAAERAGVEKPTNLHSFRHACVKRLRKDGHTWEEIGDMLAWSENSVAAMMQVYGRLDADERRAKIRQRRGIETDDGEDEPERRECPNCKREVPGHWSVCQFCHVNMDRAADAYAIEAVGDDATETAVDATDPGLIEAAKALRDATDDPEALLAAIQSLDG